MEVDVIIIGCLVISINRDFVCKVLEGDERRGLCSLGEFGYLVDVFVRRRRTEGFR